VGETLRSVDTKRSWEWLSFAATLPASPIQFLSTAANKQLAGGRYIVTAINATNAATTAGTLTLYDGQDTTGEILGVINLAAGTSLNLILGTTGTLTEIGIFMAVSGGTFTGSVLAIPLSRYNITPPGQ
jgi:hypothetical protein